MAYRNLLFHRNPDKAGHVSQRNISPWFVLAKVPLLTRQQVFKVYFSVATPSAAINTFSANAAEHSLQDFRFTFGHVNSNGSEVLLHWPLMQKYMCDNTKRGRRSTCLNQGSVCKSRDG